MIHAPCGRNGIQCENRTRNCHDTCEEYLEWREYVKRLQAENKKDRDRYKPIGRRLKW